VESLRGPRGQTRILIGFDGSGGAYDAVALAGVLAGGATAVLTYVLPHEDPLARHYKLLDHESSPAAEGFFDEAIATLGGMETEVRSYVGASPAHVLCDLAEGEDFDLVVVGSAHRRVLGRALIGSVAQALLHGSRIPIVLAPRNYADEAHESLDTIAVACDGTPESDAALRQAEGELTTRWKFTPRRWSVRRLRPWPTPARSTSTSLSPAPAIMAPWNGFWPGLSPQDSFTRRGARCSRCPVQAPLRAEARLEWQRKRSH
jgi:nucleotide-binding universal stress UspA family protein